jgi:hypothetical protein
MFFIVFVGDANVSNARCRRKKWIDWNNPQKEFSLDY